VIALGLACQDDGSRLAEAFRRSMAPAEPRESAIMREMDRQAERAEALSAAAYLGQRSGRRWGS